MEQLTVLSITDTASVLSCLQTWGIGIVPNYLSAECLCDLNAEFEAVLSGQVTDRVQDYSPDIGRGALVRLQQGHDQLPRTTQVMLADELRSIADLFFEGRCELNSDVMLMQDLVGTTHVAQELHFDVVPTLKFFLYLNDVSEENGAFCCVPGSQGLALDRRQRYGTELNYSNRHLSRVVTPSEPAIPIEGEAGTLIVFSTEVLHQAGIVQAGERRVLRGHSRKMTSTEKAGFRTRLRRWLNGATGQRGAR